MRLAAKALEPHSRFEPFPGRYQFPEKAADFREPSSYRRRHREMREVKRRAIERRWIAAQFGGRPVVLWVSEHGAPLADTHEQPEALL
jgi:hypothetical protein